MSLFNWFSPAKKKPAKPAPESSGLSRMESTKPYSPAQQHAAAPAQGQPSRKCPKACVNGPADRDRPCARPASR